jgi:hypothetical protein
MKAKLTQRDIDDYNKFREHNISRLMKKGIIQ